MRNLLLLILFAVTVVVFLIWSPSQIKDTGLLFLWGIWLLLLLFSWGRLLYLLLSYRRAKAEFSCWVPLRTGAKRLYPEYGFEVDGNRYQLVNRYHMKGDEPWPMTVLYNPRKPQKALFPALREFLLRPLLEAIGFGCTTYVLLSQKRLDVLWERLASLF